MVLFLILLLITIILAIVTVVAVSIGGATFIILFGDVIVCVFIIVWIMKRLFRRKRK